jgi:hypothetical protein
MGEVGAPGAGSGHGLGQKPTARMTTNRNQIVNRKPKRDGRAIRHNIRQINMLRKMQHPCQLRFFFTCDTDTSHYTSLKLERRSETGREKRVTPEFGEYRRRKIIPLKFRALQT